VKKICVLVLLANLMAFGEEPGNTGSQGDKLETLGNIGMGALIFTLVEASLVLNSAMLATQPLTGELVVGVAEPLLTTGLGHGNQNDYEFAADLSWWEVPVIYEMAFYGINKENTDNDRINKIAVETLVAGNLAIAGMAATNYFFEKKLKQRASVGYDPLRGKVSVAWSKGF
jgi:hypothetical protein